MRDYLPDDCAPEVAAFAAELKQRYPRFRLVAKEQSRFMRLVYFAALMPLYNKRFLTDYTTTIGYSVYMPSPVRRDPASGLRVLRHEAVHIDQFRRHPLWFPISYLLILPAGITLRARWEHEAYVESMRAELEETGAISDATIEHIVRRFTGPDYLFMDVREARVRRRLEAARSELLRRQGSST